MTQAFIQNLKPIDHASAQGAQKAILDTALAQVGFIPNMYANMANAPAVRQDDQSEVIGFWKSLAFQWVNPKAWAMALGAVTVYAPDRGLTTMALVALVFCAVNLPSVSVWTVVGQGLRRWLTVPARLRAFNWTMAGLLVLSLWPVLTH